MPFGFYAFGAEAHEPYTKTAMPLNMCAASGCDVAVLGITVVEERAQV